MARIVIHAGMGKTGSSSVKHWLGTNTDLVRQGGFTLVVAPPSEAGEIAFAPPEGRAIGSRWAIEWVLADPADVARRADRLVTALDAAARRYGDVVITAEAFERPFYDLHEPILTALQRLSGQHEVRVAYYVGPQHSSLEARWRQAGFRGRLGPSAYVERRVGLLRYAATRRGVRSIAPGLDFEPRPFRSDLLDGGDLVTDFARRFLGVEAATSARINRGLPLDVVNVLHAAPPGMFWDRGYGNRRVKLIKRLLEGRELPESERALLSRQVLRKYAHETFGAENAELGWPDFVPPPDDPKGTPGLEALDRLWEPQASPAELAFLLRALSAAIEE